ncbi:hypothetical protein HYN69_02840 [Gemmobacter aquarius]|uniref:Uncharacterized protein n=2 Tax=Paragemmobacter aquarius TaxID=2169400 RepID=A0A2S0UIC9_9RHOB|nr:hypothetical protein HYN69_02840 [Gemmobacter aquarius]
MTKIVAELFGVPALYHLDTLHHYSSFIGPTLPQVAMLVNATRRPDFIGPNAGMRYGVFESKGRTHHSNDPLRVSAKEQTAMINTINGLDPICRIACITSFGNRQMTVDVVDPTDYHKDAFSMKTENADLKEPFRLTQQLFHENVTHEKIVQHSKFKMVKLEAADLEFGLRQDIYETLEFGSNTDMEAQLKKRGRKESIVYPDSLISRLSVVEDGKEAVASDGHFVRVGPSWERWMRSTDAQS